MDLAQLGQSVANIGNASLGVISQGQVPGGSAPVPYVQPRSVGTPVNQGVTSSLPSVTASPSGSPTAPNTGVAPVTAPNGVPVASPTVNPGIPSSSFNSVYGNDVGGAVAGLLNQETPGTADSTAQAIIKANQPNVQQGADNLNTGLAASGISPSSSVSAIENANYQSQVANQDASTIAQTQLQEQQMQQQFLESLLPTQQQRETESSGWSIFGDVLSGIGSVFGV